MNRLWAIGIFLTVFLGSADAWALITPSSYSMNMPNEYLTSQFGDECYCQLTDSQFGGDNARNPSRPWVGWHWIDPRLTFYFSEGPVDINTVSIGFNKDTSVGIAREDRIFMPSQVNISFSRDGTNFDSPLNYFLDDSLYAEDMRHSVQFDTSGFRGVRSVRINLSHEYWALI
ncbi:MAG: hypothetical protein HZA19_01280, partial [Nitrospirae bacterium]|nr:hypothetical protein [Nitrospirota bacterium]